MSIRMQGARRHWAIVEPGLADQFRNEAEAARVALGFNIDSEEVAPVDLTEAIATLRAQLAAAQAAMKLASEVLTELQPDFEPDGRYTAAEVKKAVALKALAACLEGTKP